MLPYAMTSMVRACPRKYVYCGYEKALIDWPSVVGALDQRQLLRIADRQHAQQRRVEEAEDRGIRADSKRQAQQAQPP